MHALIILSEIEKSFVLISPQFTTLCSISMHNCKEYIITQKVILHGQTENLELSLQKIVVASGMRLSIFF